MSGGVCEASAEPRELRAARPMTEPRARVSGTRGGTPGLGNFTAFREPFERIGTGAVAND